MSTCSKTDLIAETKALVVSTDNTLRQIADNLARMQKYFCMSQREIAAEIGKSAAWVNRLLAWRNESFPEDTPFGGTARRERERVQRAEHRDEIKPTAVKLGNGETLKSLDGFGDAAKRQIAAAVAGDDVDPAASADRRKAENAAAESTESKAKPVGSGSGETTQVKKGSQDWLFNESVWFANHTLSKMDDATWERTMEMFRAGRAERCLKVAA